MGRKYTMGRRFHRMKFLCVGFEVLVMYAFHFLYQTLIAGLNPMMLGVGVALATAAIVFGTIRLLDWVGAHMWYQITDKGLQVSRGSKVTLYPWEDFTAAGIDNTNILSRLPAWFQLKNGKRMNLEQTTEGLGTLILDILEHIEGHAEISKDLRERLRTAQATGVRH